MASKNLKIMDFDSPMVKAAKLMINMYRILDARGQKSNAYWNSREKYLDHMSHCLADPRLRNSIVSMSVKADTPFSTSAEERNDSLKDSAEKGIPVSEAYEQLVYVPPSMLRSSMHDWGFCENCYGMGTDDDGIGVWLSLDLEYANAYHLCELFHIEYSNEIRSKHLILSLEPTDPYFSEFCCVEGAREFLKENRRESKA